MTTTTAHHPQPAALDFGPPEHALSHKLPDTETAVAWGLVPGVALCGFVFTTSNALGPTRSVQGDPRFILTPCQPCLDELSARCDAGEA